MPSLKRALHIDILGWESLPSSRRSRTSVDLSERKTVQLSTPITQLHKRRGLTFESFGKTLSRHVIAAACSGARLCALDVADGMIQSFINENVFHTAGAPRQIVAINNDPDECAGLEKLKSSMGSTQLVVKCTNFADHLRMQRLQIEASSAQSVDDYLFDVVWYDGMKTIDKIDSTDLIEARRFTRNGGMLAVTVALRGGRGIEQVEAFCDEHMMWRVPVKTYAGGRGGRGSPMAFCFGAARPI